jgi:pSer/pThr/pTyr-binding forkhead associated (FHA) protein
MREKSQEFQGEFVEEQVEEWRPQRNSWPNSTNYPAPKSRSEPPENSLARQLDKTITICVTEGRSIRTAQRLTKPRTSIGKTGGGADMQIDDPEASSLHCAVAITVGGIRLYDLDSANGTYVDDERVDAADLENLSTFRIGSTELVVSIVPNRNLDAIL